MRLVRNNQILSQGVTDMGLKPLHDRVIVRRTEEQETTAGGIIIPDSAKEKPQGGEILAAGPECKTLKAGNSVLFAKYAGTEFSMDADELLIMREDDILGVFE
jgi:chaperonin GroES